MLPSQRPINKSRENEMQSKTPSKRSEMKVSSLPLRSKPIKKESHTYTLLLANLKKCLKKVRRLSRSLCS